MSLTIPPGFASAAFIHSEVGGVPLGTKPYVWTLGIDAASATSPVDVANSLMAMWEVAWAPETDNSFQLERVELTMAAVGGGTGVAVSTDPPVPGTRLGDPTYTAFAPKVRKTTALIGRRYKGLFHPPGFLDLSDVNADGTLVTAAITRVEDACDTMTSELTTAGGLVAVLLHTSPSIDPTPIVGYSCSSSTGVLRNRMV